MEPLERPRPHRTEARHGDDERQEALVGLPAIALGEEEVTRFLKALKRPCDRTVVPEWGVSRRTSRPPLVLSSESATLLP